MHRLELDNTIIIGATNGSDRNTVTKDKKVPPPEGKGDDEEPLGVDALAAKVLDITLRLEVWMV